MTAESGGDNRWSQDVRSRRPHDRGAELGAKIIVPTTTLPDGDTMAILADPCGVTFGVVRRT